MKNDILIKKLKTEIKESKVQLKSYEKQLKEANKLPDDPSLGTIDEFGIKNENPHLKLDQVSGTQYTIGYLTSTIFQSERILRYLQMTEEEFKNDMEKDKLIDKQNAETINNLKNSLYNKLKNK